MRKIGHFIGGKEVAGTGGRKGEVFLPMTSEVRARRFLLMGFAGNSAPDHIDHFHGLEHWLKLAK